MSSEELALPGLGGGVVDLEDAQVRVGVAVGEGVEAGAEQDVLGDAARDGLGEQVFGVTAAGDEEGAQADGEGARLVRGIAAGSAFDLGGVRAEDGDGDGVVEDEGRGVVELVGGAAHGDTQGGARRARVVARGLAPAQDALEPERAEVAERDDHDGEADGQADAAVAEGEVDVGVGCGVDDEDEDDGAEGGSEEGEKAGGDSDEQAAEPAEVAERDAEQIAGAEGSRGYGCAMWGKAASYR